MGSPSLVRGARGRRTGDIAVRAEAGPGARIPSSPRRCPGRRGCRPPRGGPQGVRRDRGCGWHRPRDRRRRVLLDAGPVRVRKDDDAAHDRGFRAAYLGADPAARSRRNRCSAVRPRCQHRLPGLRALPAHERERERRLWADGAEGRSGGARPPGHRSAAHGPAGGLRAPETLAALRWPAAAGRAGQGPRQQAPRPAAR